jgi:aquaporin Z
MHAVSQREPDSPAKRLPTWVLEGLGAAFLVLCGCGTAILATAHPQIGAGSAGAALASGAAVAAMAFAMDRGTSHYFNPAVTVGFLMTGRVSPGTALVRVLVQVAGAILGALVMLEIASGRPGFLAALNGLGANGYGDHSPAGYTLGAALWTECSLTFILVIVALSVTATRERQAFAPLAVGIAVTAICFFSGPITNGAANPARSTAPALLLGDWALKQLWLFWVAPLLGGVLAGGVLRVLGVAPSSGESQHDEPAARTNQLERARDQRRARQ